LQHLYCTGTTQKRRDFLIFLGKVNQVAADGLRYAPPLRPTTVGRKESQYKMRRDFQIASRIL